MAVQKPLIAIIGATGTGKSDLAVEIATRFDGEIINADAIQMYEGLPIITNKITAAERKGIPHHLLGSIALNEPSWTVQQFLPRALEIIDDIRSRQRLPILVGGTHYYTQALLFKEHTIENNGNDQVKPDHDAKHTILDESTDAILAKLREIDPVMANRWHPNDRRKIQRSLQIYLETGKPASETYKERREEESQGASMRFPTLMLWPHCEREAHKARLDRRVDRMLEHGLLKEVAQLMALQRSQSEASQVKDHTKGIWQAIGFRQFEPYSRALEFDGSRSAELENLRKAATEQTQAATRRYAASQLKWIRIKLLNALIRSDAVPNLFVLDGTNITNWEQDVIAPSVQLIQTFLEGGSLPDARSISAAAAELLTPSKEDLTHSPESWHVHVCEVCGTKAATPQLWKMHLNSRGHKIKLSKKKAQETTSLVALEQQTGSR